MPDLQNLEVKMINHKSKKYRAFCYLTVSFVTIEDIKKEQTLIEFIDLFKSSFKEVTLLTIVQNHYIGH